MTSPTPKVTLIATTYNQPVDLDLYLETVGRQTTADFEVIIADDGSGPETQAVVDRHRERLENRLVHVWHEDLGYRKTKILNLAVLRARGELLIFTDSDLILHPHFVADHVSLRADRGLFMGRRIDLAPKISAWIRANRDRLFTPTFYAKIFWNAWGARETRNGNRAIRFGPGLVAGLLGMDRVPDLLGSNFSIDRKLLEELNGFNEALDHYWGEDGDLFVRARNAGARIIGRKSFAVQFHLWHEFRKPKPDAEAWYRKLLENRSYVRCDRGLSECATGDFKSFL